MSSISQNVDGTYNKTYSDVELYIISSLADEVKARVQGDQLLWIDVTGVTNRVKQLEDKDVNIANIQQELLNAIGRIQANTDEITRLDGLLGVDAYSKDEVDRYVIKWKVEQIPHRFATPTNEMFDKIDIDDLQSGYVGYYNADINEPHDNHIPENTMRRYTLSAYVETPREVTFNIHYADRLNVYMNDVSVGTYTDTLGNFGGVAKVLTVMLKEGWNKFQFLISNETQRGGLVIKSDLYDKANYLSNLDDLSGMITGNRIQAGTLDETHFSPNMDLVVNTLTATADNVPGVVIGDPNGCGILQIGDKTITKCINEPFVFDDGIRVNGYIYVSQLLIDVDFILQGDGILIDKIKDAATGFTRAYVIHNDLRINNGGGLTIVGDGRKGYTITNAMKLIVDQKLGGLPVNGEPFEGGLDISGDAVKGYYIRNTMLLTVEGTGGLLVTGDAQNGYFIKNTMNLSAYKGLKVEGDPSTAAGYVLKNQMGMTGDGVLLTPTPLNADYVYNWHIENDTKIDVGFGLDVQKLAAGHFKIWNILDLTGDGIGITTTGTKSTGYSKHHLTNNTSITPTCLNGTATASSGGGISVAKDGAGQFRIGNAMKMTVNNDGPVSISGDACSGYALQARWPTISSYGDGLTVYSPGGGVYQIRNDGVLGVSSGTGIAIEGSNQRPVIKNTGVLGISGGTGIAVEGSSQYPSIRSTVNVISGSSNVHVSGSGSTFVISVDEAEPQEPIIVSPPSDTGGGGGGGSSPGGGGVANTAHGNAISGMPMGWMLVAQRSSSNSDKIGIANGNLTWNDSTSFTFGIKVGAKGTGVSGSFVVEVHDGFGGTGGKVGTAITKSVPSSSKMQETNPANIINFPITVNKSSYNTGNDFHIKVFAMPDLINNAPVVTYISNPGSFS